MTMAGRILNNYQEESNTNYNSQTNMNNSSRQIINQN